MSDIYSLEPNTAGLVILQTTLGPIEIALWSKEAPKSCRNFVQLCLEGYYTNTKFTRVIKGFLIQGGDGSEDQTGGESVYGPEGFPRELHSRLKFRYRGLVACALDTQGYGHSQFFITLDRADGLNGKHSIFGKVSGPTIWNVTRIGELPTDPANDRPIDPPTITGAEVVWNPFTDIVIRQLPPRSFDAPAELPVAPKPKAKPVNQTLKEKRKALLSFDEEPEEDSDIRIKSAHDVLTTDPLLSKESAATSSAFKAETLDKIAALKQKIAGVQRARSPSPQRKSPRRSSSPQQKSPRRSPSPQRRSPRHSASPQRRSPRRSASPQRRSLKRSLSPQRRSPRRSPSPQQRSPRRSSSPQRRSPRRSSSPQRRSPRRTSVTEPEYAAVETSEGLRIKKGIGSVARAHMDVMAVADADLMKEAERLREAKKARKAAASHKVRESEALAKLQAFQSKLKNSSWLTKDGLKFAVDSSTAYAFDASHDALTVFDPLAKRK